VRSWQTGRPPLLIAASYAAILVIVFSLDLYSHGSDPWSSLVLAMGFPWSMLLMFVAAWSIAHSGYPLDAYFVPCAVVNVAVIYWVAKSVLRRPNQ